MAEARGILALDQGTTGSTALLVSGEGRVLGRSYSEFTQHYPSPGWVEHDPLEIEAVTLRVAREALADARRREPVEVAGVGITNQRETVVLWDRETLEPVHPAVVWQDRRTTGICRELRDAGHLEEVRRRTGLVLDPYFSATKIRWILDRDPGLRRRAEAGELAAGTVDSWLMARLTGGAVHATDPTNASRTLLWNLKTRSWDPWLLELFGVPEALLPEVRSSSGPFGVARGEALGLEVPILGVAGDQQAALFGQGCWSPGLAKNTYGTGAFLLQFAGSEPPTSDHGLLTTAACGPRGELGFALEGSVFVAGAAIQWLRDGLGLLETSGESEALARSVESTDGVVFVPAFVGLGAPHWEPEARGTVLGLTRGTTRAHLVRAALEAMALSTWDLLRAMESDSGVRASELRVDGGATTNDWLMAFQAGVLGIPIRRPAMVETTAFGAAGLAGVAAGIWEDGPAFLSTLEAPTIFPPSLDEDTRRRILGDWARGVDAALRWARWEDPVGDSRPGGRG